MCRCMAFMVHTGVKVEERCSERKDLRTRPLRDAGMLFDDGWLLFSLLLLLFVGPPQWPTDS